MFSPVLVLLIDLVIMGFNHRQPSMNRHDIGQEVLGAMLSGAFGLDPSGPRDIFQGFGGQTSGCSVFSLFLALVVTIMVQKVIVASTKSKKVENILRKSDLSEILSESFDVLHTDLIVKGCSDELKGVGADLNAFF